MIGQLLARRYKIIRVLGAGGFSQTYVAQDTHIPGNPTCVVKHLKPASDSPNLLAMARQLFQREAETLVKLGNHYQIPRLFAYFEEDQEFYLVQEFIEGHTLATELPLGKCLPESQVIQLLEEVLNILEFVHGEGVIHRDIKPDNIIRRESDDKLVLIDFGAIKQVQKQLPSVAAQEQSVATSTRIGTPGYSPTEQDRGKPRLCSDIYALGMLGIQALTGVSPDELQEDDETGEILWQDQAPVSSELAAILTKMVRYHFKDRYQSATEALDALDQLKNPSPTPTVQATVVDHVTHSVPELVLEWVEGENQKTQAIRENQPSKNPGTVRIGRDPALCDIVLSEPTVSGLHTEIFFNPEEKSFYLRSLRESNPPVVDGQPLPTGEVILHQGSNLQLGQMSLRVVAIELNPLTTTREYTPTQTVIQQVTASPQPVAPTVQPPPVQTVSQNTDSSSSINQTEGQVSTQTNSSSSTSNNRLPLLIGLGVAALLSVGGAYAYVQSQPNNSGTTVTSTAKLDSTAKSSPTDTSTPKLDSTAKSSPTDTSTPKLDSTAKSDSTDTSTPKSDSTTKSESAEIPIANSDLTQPPRDNGLRILTKARNKAKSGDFQGAINLAEQVSSSSSVYERAQNAIARWQERQQQTLSRQQSENRATSLLAKAQDIAKTGEEGDIETAIGIAEEAMVEAPPQSPVYKQAQSAIAQWEREGTPKREPEATPKQQPEAMPKRQPEAASSYACSCQLNEPDDQKAAIYKESPNDLTGSNCATPGEPEDKPLGVWKCNKP